MTLEEIFEKVEERAKTKVRSLRTGDDGGCAYRGGGGLCCFVGILIPDAEYDPAIEGCSIQSLKTGVATLPGCDAQGRYSRRQNVLDVCGLSEHLALLDALQYIHDDVPTHEWDGAIKELKQRYLP